MNRQRTRADRDAWFAQAPVVAIEPGESAGIRIDRDDGDGQFDDLIVTGCARGFGVKESDLHGGQGWMLGLAPRRAGR